VEEKDFLLELILRLLILALNDFQGFHGQLHAVLEEPLGPQLPIVHLVMPVLLNEVTRVLRVLALEGLQEIYTVVRENKYPKVSSRLVIGPS
jgi:hypothetical protein